MRLKNMVDKISRATLLVCAIAATLGGANAATYYEATKEISEYSFVVYTASDTLEEAFDMCWRQVAALGQDYKKYCYSTTGSLNVYSVNAGWLVIAGTRTGYLFANRTCGDIGRWVPPGTPGVETAYDGACIAQRDVFEDARSDSKSCTVMVGDSISPTTGTKHETQSTGIVLGAMALDLSYDSLRTADNSKPPPDNLASLPVKPPPADGLGPAWTSSYHRNISMPLRSQTLRANRGDGRYVAYYQKGTAFVPDPGVKDTLTGSRSTGFVYTDARDRSVETYDSTGKITSRTTPDGSVLHFRYSTGASSDAAMSAPGAGYLVEVSDAAGRAVKFSYNTQGLSASPLNAGTNEARVTKITDPAGAVIRLDYTDGNGGQLKAIHWPDGGTVNYLYETTVASHFAGGSASLLTGKVDENGQRVETTEYDSQGHAIGTSRAGGVDSYRVSYDTAPLLLSAPPEVKIIDGVQTMVNMHQWRPITGLTITNPMGASSRVTTDSSLGFAQVTDTTQPAGSGCGAATMHRTLDAKGNVLSQDDFSGARSCYAYDEQSRETVRVEGLASTVACDTVLADHAAMPVGARKTTYAYSADGLLPTVVTSPVAVQTTVFQGQPDPFNANVAANCSAAPALANGKALALVCKQIIQNATVEAQSPAAAPAANAAVYSYTYDQRGHVLTAVDPANQTTTFAYYQDAVPGAHMPGDLQLVTDAAGATTRYDAYDANGRLLQMTDSKGTVTRLDYTLRGWIASVVVTPPGMSARTTSYRYDNAGQVTQVSADNGIVTNFSYDAAHRLIGATDGQGNKVSYNLDNAGNRVVEQIRDPSGNVQRSIQRSFDALNRLQEQSGATTPGI